MKKIVIAAAMAMIATPLGAQSNCTWTWDCTSGQCRQVPICRNTFDIPPPRPPQIPPIPAPTIRPIPTPTIPPIGTRTCAPRYICSGNGQCVWKTVCQ